MEFSFEYAALIALGGYLLGSIPFGLVLTQLCGLGDIREIGSGNIGATNVLRTGRKDLALLTLLLDSGKGAIAALIAHGIAGPDYAPICAAAAFLGHCYPIFLKFKGGKGVATFLGAALAINPMIGLTGLMAWVFVALFFRISSLSALIAAASLPFVAYLRGEEGLAPYLAFMALIIFFRHRDNIRRIMRGEEPKIGKKSEAPPT